MNYKQTVNTGRTRFAMRAELAKREPDFQRIWVERKVYETIAQRNAAKGTYVLHDGPPYANGHIHMGTATNKILKDFVVKYKAMDGYRTPYIPGWDCHGMPIEIHAAKEFRSRGISPTRLELRHAARKHAEKFMAVQREEFKRLGCIGDWEHPYLTMSHTFEAEILRIFGELVERGFIYRGKKPVNWCTDCQTALAEAEIEYHEHTSPSIDVRFALQRDPNGIFKEAQGGRAYTMIWTTTPWTIPANLAVAFHPDFTYVLAENGEDTYLLARELLPRTEQRTGLKLTVRREISGKECVGMSFRHPLYDRESVALLADFVTLDEGTGVVHIAPGHGSEDYHLGLSNGLEPYCPVDESGHFTDDAEGFEGLFVHTGNEVVLEELKSAHALMSHGTIDHQYPHCWRCHNPTIFRAATQWFMSIDHNDHRQRALDQIARVKWYPEDRINRITAAVGGRPDWCLSRQRSWGVGIPAFYCAACREPILTPETIRFVHSIILQKGSDAWFELDVAELIPPGYQCPKCGTREFTKETDVLDVWFDSGCTGRIVCEGDQRLAFPVDLYLEGSDQHRGWFNSSLMVTVGTRDIAPYKAVITHGWILDGEGRAMHKSLGNVVSPNDEVTKYGADVLRLWVASTDYFDDVRYSSEIVEFVVDAYRRIRNTFRFLLMNLEDLEAFDPARDCVPFSEMEPIDLYIISRLQGLVRQCRDGYDSFQFNRVYHSVHTFCNVELSSFYFDASKDVLYTSPRSDPKRRSTVTAFYHLLHTLTRLLAPIVSHTSEEVWQTAQLSRFFSAESVLLAEMPIPDGSLEDAALEEAWGKVMTVRDAVYRQIEVARQEKIIAKPLEAKVTISLPSDALMAVSRYEKDLPRVLIVSEVELCQNDGGEVTAKVEQASGERCERCWLILPDVGIDANHPTICARCARAMAELASNVGG